MAASIGCAIHCAAMPFVIAFLPMFGLSFLADDSFHKVMVGVCSLFALAAFIPGWRIHRRWLPSGIAVVGLAVIGVSAFVLEDECGCCSVGHSKAVVLPQGPAEAGKTEVSLVVKHLENELDSCDDACCEHHGTDHDDVAVSGIGSSDMIRPGKTSLRFAGFIPWITPLGGLLLVSSHLLNRRYSCRCGCCPTDSENA